MAQREAEFLLLIDKQNLGIVSLWDTEKENQTRSKERGGGLALESLMSPA